MKNKKLTIGIFTYDFFPIFGGIGRHVYEIYKQNQKHKDASMFIFSPNINNLENHISLFPETKKGKFKNMEFSLKLHTVFEKLIKEYKIDIVHLHGGPGGIFLFKKLSVPVVYTTHHTYWQQYSYINNQKWKYIFYLFEKRSYQLVQKIICVSNDTQKILEKQYSQNKSRLVYIPNGIDMRLFKPQKKFLVNSKKIIYVGRIDKRKGVDFLVKTMAAVHQIDPQITLHIVGEGALKPKLEALSKINKLPIFFYGKLSDEKLSNLYEKIAIQVVPSIFEGFGISVLEGMAKKVCIIATETDGIKELVQNNKYGKLVPYGDIEFLAKTILEVINNTLLRKKLINNAYEKLKDYAWESIYYALITVYEKII